MIHQRKKLVNWTSQKLWILLSDSAKKMNGLDTDGEKIFANNISHKRHIWNTYIFKNSTVRQNKKTIIPVENGQKTWIEISPKRISMELCWVKKKANLKGHYKSPFMLHFRMRRLWGWWTDRRLPSIRRWGEGRVGITMNG